MALNDRISRQESLRILACCSSIFNIQYSIFARASVYFHVAELVRSLSLRCRSGSWLQILMEHSDKGLQKIHLTQGKKMSWMGYRFLQDGRSRWPIGPILTGEIGLI